MCTQEIPVTFRGEEMHVDPFSLVLQHTATRTKCRKKTPPRWRIGREWICGYPEIRLCGRPGPLPGHQQKDPRDMVQVVRFDPGRGRIEVHPEPSGERHDGGVDLPQETLDALAKAISNH